MADPAPSLETGVWAALAGGVGVALTILAKAIRDAMRRSRVDEKRGATDAAMVTAIREDLEEIREELRRIRDRVQDLANAVTSVSIRVAILETKVEERIRSLEARMDVAQRRET
jgi:archaellum component FlaC